MKYQKKIIVGQIEKLNRLLNFCSEDNKLVIKKSIKELEQALMFLNTKKMFYNDQELNTIDNEILKIVLNNFQNVPLIDDDQYPLYVTKKIDLDKKLNKIVGNLILIDSRFKDNLNKFDKTNVIQKNKYFGSVNSGIYRNYYDNELFYGITNENSIADVMRLNSLISQGFKSQINDLNETFDNNAVFGQISNYYLLQLLKKDPDYKQEIEKYDVVFTDYLVYISNYLKRIIKNESYDTLDNKTRELIVDLLNKIIGKTIYDNSLIDKEILNEEINDISSKSYYDKLNNLNITDKEINRTCNKIMRKQERNYMKVRK